MQLPGVLNLNSMSGKSGAAHRDITDYDFNGFLRSQNGDDSSRSGSAGADAA